jgi:hypothetical protein
MAAFHVKNKKDATIRELSDFFWEQPAGALPFFRVND